MPVLEQTPTETIRRSVAASIKSPSKKSKVNPPSSRTPQLEPKRIVEQALEKSAANAVTAQLTEANTAVKAIEKSATKDGAAKGKKVCLIEPKLAAYQPDHQVELLHLQAEADALLVKLQATEQQKRAADITG